MVSFRSLLLEKTAPVPVARNRCNRPDNPVRVVQSHTPTSDRVRESTLKASHVLSSYPSIHLSKRHPAPNCNYNFPVVITRYKQKAGTYPKEITPFIPFHNDSFLMILTYAVKTPLRPAIPPESSHYCRKHS